MFHLVVRSRNKSCQPLKDIIVPRRTILRLGSTTSTESIARHNGTKPSKYTEINTAEACSISGNKILMKEHFTRAKINTAPWFQFSDKGLDANTQKIKHYLKKWKTLIVKHKYSSKGNGIYLIKDIEEFIKLWNEIFCQSYNNYIIEKYYSYSREYRIHITEDGYFLADRKMLKNDAEVRWHRHAENSVWIKEENPQFNKPNNWDDIVKDCVAALEAVHLDIGAVDVKVQSSKELTPKWIILEINSAPALGEDSIIRYKEVLNLLIDNNVRV